MRAHIVDDEDDIAAPKPMAVVACEPSSHGAGCIGIDVLHVQSVDKRVHLTGKLAAVVEVLRGLPFTIKENHIVRAALTVVARVLRARIAAGSRVYDERHALLE